MTTESFNDPVDVTHAESVMCRNEIRMMFQEAKDRVARWEPLPMPETFQGA
jgi:hypothetical protein